MNSLFDLKFLEQKNSDNNQLTRLLIISFFIAILGLVIIMRLFEISLSANKKNENIIKNKLVDEKKNRGLLFDRNGRILASNIYIYNLKAYPKKIKDPKKTLELVEEKIDIFNKNSLLEKLKNKSKFEIILKEILQRLMLR